MLTTYEKIYRALKDKNANKFNVANQIYLIEREELSHGYRFNLFRWYISGYKVNLQSFVIRDNALPPNYKKCIRKFLQEIFTSCVYNLHPSLDKYTSRAIRKANYIYQWGNKWDRVSDIEECYINCYDHDDVFICHEFCGWRKKTYLTW